MQRSEKFKHIFACCAFIVEVIGVLLLMFSIYAFYKCDEVKSALSIFTAVFGAAVVASFVLNDCVSSDSKKVNLKRAILFIDSLILAVLITILITAFLFADQLSAFFIDELSILRDFNGKAKIFRETIVKFEQLLDCCRLPNIVGMEN
jgi:putative flippase GtrA